MPIGRGLRSKEWFFGECLGTVAAHGKFCHLAWQALALGIQARDKTRGHVLQAIGAGQMFLSRFPAHRTGIQAADPTEPVTLGGRMKKDLVAFMRAQKGGPYGKFGYDWDTCRSILTPAIGGLRRAGGGGDYEFKLVLRLLAEFP